MRHHVRGRKLGRTASHRRALFRNQLTSLMAEERLLTTLHKAKELRPLAERVVTHGKRGTVQARRWVRRWIADRELVGKLFDDIAPRFTERPGGYLRIVKLGPRRGDGAEMAVLEFVASAEVAAAAEPEKTPRRRGLRRRAKPAPEKFASEEPPKAAKTRAGKAGKPRRADAAKKAAGAGEKAATAEGGGEPSRKGGKAARSGRKTARRPKKPS